MQFHVVHAHPSRGSYNAELTETAARTLRQGGHTVSISDLYQQRFDPVEGAAHYSCHAPLDDFVALREQREAWRAGSLPGDVISEIKNLEQADVVIFQFPLWWHGPPAILKGWMDRVFVNGGLYTSQKRYDTGHFKGRRALLSVTTGAPREAFGPGSRGGDLDVMLWPLQYSLHYVGFSVLPPFVSYGVQGHGYRYEDEEVLDARLRDNLETWSARLSELEALTPIQFPSWKDWDSAGSALRSEGLAS